MQTVTVYMFVVLTLTLYTLSYQNYFFQRVWEVSSILVEIPEGWVAGYFCVHKMEIPRRRKSLHEIPSMMGVCKFSGILT